MATQHPSATAAQTNSYIPRIVATGLATAAGAVLTSVMDARGTLVGAVLVAMIVSGVSQVVRVPLERRVKSLRTILIIAFMGFLVGMGAMHAREIAQGRMLGLSIARTLLADLAGEDPATRSSDAAPTVEDAVPTPEKPGKQSPSDTSTAPTGGTSRASDTAKPPQSDAAKPAGSITTSRPPDPGQAP